MKDLKIVKINDFNLKSRVGFTLLEVMAASAVIAIVSYLIISQIVSLQTKINRYTQLPQTGRFVNNAVGEGVPFDVNFKKGNLGNYANNDYSWQLQRKVVEICSRYFSTQETKKECYMDLYVFTVDVGEQTDSGKEENKKEIYFLKTIEEGKEVAYDNEK